MTESEWLLSTDPHRMMLTLLNPHNAKSVQKDSPFWTIKVSKRKLRLFCYESYRVRYGYKLPGSSPWSQWGDGEESTLEKQKGQTPWGDAIAACSTEYKKDENTNTQLTNLLRSIIGNPFRPIQIIPAEEPNIWEAIPILVKAATEKNYFFMGWVNDTVRNIAQNIYEKRDWEGLPILADALEDQGCCNEDMLRHLRGYQRCGGNGNSERVGNDHIDHFDKYFCDCDGTGWIVENPLIRCRGDWVLDIILGKE